MTNSFEERFEKLWRESFDHDGEMDEKGFRELVNFVKSEKQFSYEEGKKEERGKVINIISQFTLYPSYSLEIIREINQESERKNWRDSGGEGVGRESGTEGRDASHKPRR